METEIATLIQTYAGQGIFFILFMMLFKKQMEDKDNMKKEYIEREEKLSVRLGQNDEVLKEAVQQLKVLEDIKIKVDEIHKRA